MFVGIDLGTSGLRALLIDEAQQVVAAKEASYDTTRPHAGWSEQAQSDWTDACITVFAELRAEAPAAVAAIRGIGVSGHMHGANLLDAAGTPLRPCMMWNDTRSVDQAAKLDATANVRDLSGNIVFPGFTAPKVAWVADNEADIFAKTAKVLLPKDYLNFWLTGVYASDMSDSAGTSWLDVGARDWSEDLLAASGMRRDQMPDLFEGSDAIGTVRSDIASLLGLPDDVVVAAGAGDNAAAACGIGALGEGDGFVSLGTSGVLLAGRDAYAPKPASAVHTFCHAIPDRWYQMGVILAATDCLNWLSRNLQESPADLTRALGDTISGPGKMRFLPYLSGERTPHNDADVRGAFIGLDIASGHQALTQAVLEGVTFALRDNLEALKSTGAKLDQVIAIGGGSQSPFWVELIATVLNLPIALPKDGEFGAALGAARLAICAATDADPVATMTRPDVATIIQPRSDLRDDYEAAYAAFRNSYSGIKALQS
ncbi:Xylulose kinase [Shimia sp. SK013]|uniref:xylulokinase n=1 Tax=Shimia sp. SK013 TaxID=1389006 RepID=UPI0006B6332D|nr:xylulokinase [Shimia sp. SK013]KPA21482.1 Xylulose kinase [Shimia sp. SK013]